MNNFGCIQLSSLEKIFPNSKPKGNEYENITALANERISYQIAYFNDTDKKHDLRIGISSPLEKLITLRKVGYVPSEMPAYPGAGKQDENYITFEPGLFPDPLYPVDDYTVEALPGVWQSIWITINLNGRVKAGPYKIDITLSCNDFTFTKTMNVEIIGALLPEQKLIFTQWFHCDCIATYYNVEIFSDEHWSLIDKFLQLASYNGINMILTPIFTPPLDTEVGGERPTVQLVDIKKDGEQYTFGYTRLKKWVGLCRSRGIKYFEMAHLFTQWGAKFTPKIMAVEGGEEKRIFGWDVEATSPEYKNFTDQFLPSLIAFLKEEDIAQNTYFHISDEPHGEEHKQNYAKAKDMVKEHLGGFKIIDALSDYDFYSRGIVESPIPASNHIVPFLENNVPDLWTYYCCAQAVGVSNRFMAMPSYRNRIIAVQLYKYNIKGFLHWGYNFYYSSDSKEKIDPFITTDQFKSTPSGDAFSVYPYTNGPIESLRIVVFYEALQDLRAMELLESCIGKDAVVKLIEDEAATEITFNKYPQNPQYILNLRDKINRAIGEHIR